MGLLPDLVREFKGPEALTRLLTYAIRCSEVSPIALLKLRPEDFDPTTEPEFQVAWIASKAYWDQHNTQPPRQYMLDICPAVLRAQGVVEAAPFQRVAALIDAIYSADPLQLDPQYGKTLIKAFLGRRFIEAVGQLGATQTDATKVYELIDGEYRKRHVVDMYEIDPFDINENTSFGEQREPLGTPVIDMLMSGGTFPTDVLGILGPTGGGKTTLALQIAGGCALRKQHVLYFTYETSPDELRPRLVSCVGRISRDKLEGKHFSDLDDQTKDAVRKASDACRQYIALLDRSSEGWSPIEIEERLKQSINVGQKPRLVVIDWLWIAVSRAAGESDRRGRPERQFLNDLLDSFKGMAVKYKVNFLILQQLSTAQAKQSPGRKPQWFNSAEAGSFAWLLSYCFAIGTADANGYCHIVGSKARHAKKQDTVARMMGEYNRFDLVDKDMEFKKGRGFVSADKVHSLNDDDEEEQPNKIQSNYEQSTDFA
jgi:hypothetical protein